MLFAAALEGAFRFEAIEVGADADALVAFFRVVGFFVVSVIRLILL